MRVRGLPIDVAFEPHPPRRAGGTSSLRRCANAGKVGERCPQDGAAEADAELVHAGDAATRNDESVTDHECRDDEADERHIVANLPHHDFFSLASPWSAISTSVASTSFSSTACGDGSQCRCTAQNAMASRMALAAIWALGTGLSRPFPMRC